MGRKDSEELSVDKRRFLSELNLSDKLLRGLSQQGELSSENKKLLL